MHLHLKTVWALLRQTWSDWNRHEATRLGASLAFYAVLSLAPLVILTLAVASLFIDPAQAQRDVAMQFQDLLGADGAQAVQSVIVHGQDLRVGSVASAAGLLILLFGASQVFADLQSALNKIWEADQARTKGVFALIRERFFSFGLVLAIGLLLLVSLLLSAALSAAGTYMHGVLPLPEWLLHVFDFLFTGVGTSALFALIFKYIPDGRTDWWHSWIGGFVTAGLFGLGKSIIGLYLGKAGIGSAYGAAGSLVVVVAWVYYSSQIFFFGAEFTHVITGQRTRGVKTRQASHATAPHGGRKAVAASR
ncbi:MAG: YihY/virulence factor BrkB family protein [Steroidobacteraceae bacterium]